MRPLTERPERVKNINRTEIVSTKPAKVRPRYVMVPAGSDCRYGNSTETNLHGAVKREQD